MKDKQYLTENNYQKGKKGLTVFGLIVIIAGLLLGGLLIFNGIKTINENNKDNEKKEESKEQQLLILKQELDVLKQELESLNTNLNQAQIEKQKIFSEDKGFC